MRRIISFVHLSLDGFVAGPKGDMSWIKHPDELFDWVGTLTDKADAALYGRTTYEMMQSYWPTAADKPNATKHDKEHSAWYSKVHKIVLSKTLNGKDLKDTTVISDNLNENITKIKGQEGKNILLLGSPGATQSLLRENLIDEFLIAVNPIVLGEGVPFFKGISATKLKFLDYKTFPDGVIVLRYERTLM